MKQVHGTKKHAQQEANRTGTPVWCYRDDNGRADGGGFWVKPASPPPTYRASSTTRCWAPLN